MSFVRSGAIGVAASIVIACVPLAAQTIVVTPSNPQGWAGTTYYGPGGTGSGTGAFGGITTAFPHSGNGSVEISLADAVNSEADWALTFAGGPYALSSLSTLAYDWYRSSTSTVNAPGLMPAFALSMSDGSYLVYERAYNATDDAPVDQWVTSNILNGTFWFTGNGSGSCGVYGAFQTLSKFNTQCFGGSGAVSGLDLFMGYAYEGSFRGAVDNVSYAFDTPDPTFNFEVDAGISTTPEPATMSLMAFGLAGMAGAGIRRRKRSR